MPNSFVLQFLFQTARPTGDMKSYSQIETGQNNTADHTETWIIDRENDIRDMKLMLCDVQLEYLVLCDYYVDDKQQSRCLKMRG